MSYGSSLSNFLKKLISAYSCQYYLLSSVLSTLAILVSVRWCLVVLIAMSLVKSDIDCLFMSLCSPGVLDAGPCQSAHTCL